MKRLGFLADSELVWQAKIFCPIVYSWAFDHISHTGTDLIRFLEDEVSSGLFFTPL